MEQYQIAKGYCEQKQVYSVTYWKMHNFMQTMRVCSSSLTLIPVPQAKILQKINPDKYDSLT